MDLQRDNTEEIISKLFSNHLISTKISTFLTFEDLLEFSQVNRDWRALCRTQLRKRTCVARMHFPRHKKPRSVCLAIKSFNNLLQDCSDSPFSGIFIICYYNMHKRSPETCSPLCFNTSEEEDPNPLETTFTSLRRAPDMWKRVTYGCQTSFLRCPAIRAFRILFAENSLKINILNFRHPHADEYTEAFQHLTRFANSKLAFPNLEFLYNTSLDTYMSFREIAPKLREITCGGVYTSEKHPVPPRDFYDRLVSIYLQHYLKNPELYRNCRPKYAVSYYNLTETIDYLRGSKPGISKIGTRLTLNVDLCHLTAHVLTVAFISIQNIPAFVNLKNLHFVFNVPDESTRLEKSGFQYINFNMFPHLEKVILGVYNMKNHDESHLTVVQFKEMNCQQQLSRTVKRLELEHYFFKIRGLPYLAHLFPNVMYLKLNRLTTGCCPDQQTREELYLKGNFRALETIEAGVDVKDCPIKFLQNFFGTLEGRTCFRENLTDAVNPCPESRRLYDCNFGDLLNPAIFYQTGLKEIILCVPYDHGEYCSNLETQKHRECLAAAVTRIQILLSTRTVEFASAQTFRPELIFANGCNECRSQLGIPNLQPIVGIRAKEKKQPITGQT